MAGKLFSVSDFAKFSRVTKAILLHYDKIGLLSPKFRGSNKYRFYSTGQLSVVNLIRTLQEFGLTLNGIKKLKNQRTPEEVSELLVQLMEKTDDKIVGLLRSRKLLFTLLNTILSALNVDEGAVTIQSLPAKAIILGEVNDYSQGRNDFDALRTFYHAVSKRYLDVDLNYPVWALFSMERIQRGDWNWPDRYYFYHPDGPDQRPAARYAIGYARGGYGYSGSLYERLMQHITKNGFEICGDAYEEYPLNEICVADENNYLKRIMIPVREKEPEG